MTADRVAVHHRPRIVAVRRPAVVLVAGQCLSPFVLLRVEVEREMPLDDDQLPGRNVVPDLLRLGRFLLERLPAAVRLEVAPDVLLEVVQPGAVHLPVVRVPDTTAFF